MPWSWGGAAQGASRGVTALVDLLQANQAAARQKEIDDENKRQRDLANADRDATRRRQAMIDLPGMQAAGGYVDDTVPQPTSKTPGLPAMPSVGNVSRGTPERSAQVTTARRPLVLGDLLSTDANVGNDPSQSQSAIKQRTQGAALQRFQQTKSDADRAAALAAGVPPAMLDEIAPKPAAPKEATPLWGPGTQFPTEDALIEHNRKNAVAMRAPITDRRTPATYTDDVTGQPVQGSFDPQTGTYYDSQGKPRQAAPKQSGQSAGGAGGAENIKKAEQLGLALNNYSDLMPAMEKRKFQGPGFFTGIASAAQHAGGVEGSVGNYATNVADRDWNTLSGNIDLLLSAAAHSVGGARITPEQIKMFTGGFVPGSGDNSAQGKQKFERAMDFLNASAAVLPPEMVTDQLKRIPADRLRVLQSYGFGNPPTPEAMALVEKMQQAVNAPTQPPGAGGRTGQSPAPTTAPTTEHPQAANVAATIRALQAKLGRTPTAAEVKAAMGQ